MVLLDILGRDLAHIDFLFTSNLLNLKLCVLYLMVTYIMLPRYGSYMSFSIFDALLIFNIKQHMRLDLPYTMLTYICSSSFYDAKTILSYIMYLIKVFHFFGVELSNETSSKLHHTHYYKHDSYLCLPYSFDDTRKAYHCMIARQDVYVFTCHTRARYLLNGYSEPTGIPYNDKDDVEVLNSDKGNPSDIPPLSDDPIIADLGTFSS